jgi:hypothetical protein
VNIEFDDDSNEREMTIAIAEKVWLRMQRKYKPVIEELDKHWKQKEGEK